MRRPLSYWVCEFVWEWSTLGKTYAGPFLIASVAFMVSSVVAGAQSTDSLWWIYFIGFSVTFTSLVIGLDRLNSWLAVNFIKAKFKIAKVGILTAGDNKPDGLSEPFTPSDWAQAFSKEEKDRVEIEPRPDMGSYYGVDIIVNPIEEAYPEIDIANQTFLKALTEFMHHGGVIVATGGLPFFWVIDFHRLSAGIRGFTGSFLDYYAIRGRAMVPAFNPKQASLLNTWAYNTFGVMTTIADPQDVKLDAVEDPYFHDLLPVGSVITVKEFRSPFRCDSREAKLIPIVKAELDFQGHVLETYPIAAVKYGIGYLVIFAIKLEQKDRALMSRVNAAILKKLREKGCLD